MDRRFDELEKKFEFRPAPGVRYKEVRVPIDRAGNPTDPNTAYSVRYERIPMNEGGGGESRALEKIAELEKEMRDNKFQDMSNRISDLQQQVGAQSDFGMAVVAIKDMATTFFDSDGGPLVKAINPVLESAGKKVLYNYNALSPMPEAMQTPQEPAPFG